MSSEKSDEMMALLQELVALKQLDESSSRVPGKDRVAHKQREQRRSEIYRAIKRLGSEQRRGG